MTMTDFLVQAKKKWQTILVIVFSATAITFSVSAFLPAQYLSEVSILVIQKQTINKVDAFSAAKSAEYLSEILSQVIYSQSFLEDVLTAPFENKKTFSSNITERELQWKRTVEAKKVNNTGIVKIKVYAKSKVEAESTAQAVAWALSVRGHKYHGGGDWVKIVTIDGPSTSTSPAKPNLGLNTLLGFLVGFGLAGAVLFFLPELNLIVFGRKKKAILTKEKVRFDLGNKSKSAGAVFLREGSLSGAMLKKALNYSQEEDYRPFIKKTSTSSLDFFKKESQPSGQEEVLPVEESVRVIEPVLSTERKAPAPENLPIFQEEEIAEEEIMEEDFSVDKNDFVNLNELDRAVEKQSAPEIKVTEGEPSEEEVRARLNKLLKGE